MANVAAASTEAARINGWRSNFIRIRGTEPTRVVVEKITNIGWCGNDGSPLGDG
jgi:hypothetical protein